MLSSAEAVLTMWHCVAEDKKMQSLGALDKILVEWEFYPLLNT